MSLLEKRLTRQWAEEVMSDEKRLISAIIYDLQEMGNKIAEELDIRDYETLEEFLAEQDRGRSPFDVLEGKADRKSNVYVLPGCPMVKLVESLKDEKGKLPKFYLKIGDRYKEMYKTKGAILHPFCIVHQVIRALIGEKTKVRGQQLKVYQVACRALKSGKTAYATEGMDRIGLDKEDVDRMIDGNACMYLVKF
jgi:ASC-1-like (ASCH) protein